MLAKSAMAFWVLENDKMGQQEEMCGLPTTYFVTTRDKRWSCLIEAWIPLPTPDSVHHNSIATCIFPFAYSSLGSFHGGKGISLIIDTSISVRLWKIHPGATCRGTGLKETTKPFATYHGISLVGAFIDVFCISVCSCKEWCRKTPVHSAQWLPVVIFYKLSCCQPSHSISMNIITLLMVLSVVIWVCVHLYSAICTCCHQCVFIYLLHRQGTDRSSPVGIHPVILTGSYSFSPPHRPSPLTITHLSLLVKCYHFIMLHGCCCTVYNLLRLSF